MKKLSFLISILGILFVVNVIFGSTAWAAATLTANMTVDDDFDLYISTDDTQIGSFIGSGTGIYSPPGWNQTYTFMTALTPGVVNYIHVVGWDLYTVRAGFLGDFSLSDNSFAFANGTQNLVTASANWFISNTGFAQSYYIPDAIALNGGGPWNVLIPGISAGAYWIWSNQGYDLTTRYFSTAIEPIPAPGAILLASIGAGFAGWLRRQRRI